MSLSGLWITQSSALGQNATQFDTWVLWWQMFTQHSCSNQYFDGDEGSFIWACRCRVKCVWKTDRRSVHFSTICIESMLPWLCHDWDLATSLGGARGRLSEVHGQDDCSHSMKYSLLKLCWTLCRTWLISFGQYQTNETSVNGERLRETNGAKAMTAWMVATSSAVSDAAAAIGLHNEVLNSAVLQLEQGGVFSRFSHFSYVNLKCHKVGHMRTAWFLACP